MTDTTPDPQEETPEELDELTILYNSLTKEEQSYCDQFIAIRIQIDAYLNRAHKSSRARRYKNRHSASQKAWQFHNRPHVKEYITRRIAQDEELETYVTRLSLIEKHLDMYNRMEKIGFDGNEEVARRCLESVAKLRGFADKETIKETRYISTQEMREGIERLESQVAKMEESTSTSTGNNTNIEEGC